MAEKQTLPQPGSRSGKSSTTATAELIKNEVKPSNTPRPLRPKRPPLNQIYALPAPIRTFPLPSFYPNNPISLIHLLSAWMTQVVSPPPPEPSVVHEGIWVPESRSVHVVDHKSMRALWEQGFYGKGSLSRSEPQWLDRQKARKGLGNGDLRVHEELTAERRAARAQAKWERAREQQEAIEQVRQREAARETRLEAVAPAPSLVVEPVLDHLVPPVGPLEILAMPNSQVDLASLQESSSHAIVLEESSNGSALTTTAHGSAAGRKQSLPNGDLTPNVSSAVNGAPATASERVGVLKLPSSASSDSGSDDSKSLKRRKSVRFSPTVESTTFKLEDPPSPMLGALSKLDAIPVTVTVEAPPRFSWVWNLFQSKTEPHSPVLATTPSPVEIDNLEHLQLMPEEAFYLQFALGALKIVHPTTKDLLSTTEVFMLFRQYSYFPPRMTSTPYLQPDDPFLVNYVVYHHFRSLGWCIRSGFKFGVDWMLYLRGPVFNHAEFGLHVTPSYCYDPWWKAHGKQSPSKEWHLISGVNRVLSHVFKSLVLIYVEIPAPPSFEEAMKTGGLVGVFKRYQVREILIKRWSPNRNRSSASNKWTPRNGKAKK